MTAVLDALNEQHPPGLCRRPPYPSPSLTLYAWRAAVCLAPARAYALAAAVDRGARGGGAHSSHSWRAGSDSKAELAKTLASERPPTVPTIFPTVGGGGGDVASGVGNAYGGLGAGGGPRGAGGPRPHRYTQWQLSVLMRHTPSPCNRYTHTHTHTRTQCIFIYSICILHIYYLSVCICSIYICTVYIHIYTLYISIYTICLYAYIYIYTCVCVCIYMYLYI